MCVKVSRASTPAPRQSLRGLCDCCCPFLFCWLASVSTQVHGLKFCHCHTQWIFCNSDATAALVDAMVIARLMARTLAPRRQIPTNRRSVCWSDRWLWSFRLGRIGVSVGGHRCNHGQHHQYHRHHQCYHHQIELLIITITTMKECCWLAFWLLFTRFSSLAFQLKKGAVHERAQGTFFKKSSKQLYYSMKPGNIML